MHDPHLSNHAAVTLVPRHLSQPRKFPWPTFIAYIVGALGLALAGVTLALFMLSKVQVATEVGQLRAELATAQTQATRASSGQSDLTRRLDGMTRDVNALQALVSGYTGVCSTDLTGQSGPAVFDFPCQQKS